MAKHEVAEPKKVVYLILKISELLLWKIMSSQVLIWMQLFEQTIDENINHLASIFVTLGN